MGGGMSLVLAGVGSYYAWVTPASGFVLPSLSLPTVTFPDVEPKVLVTMGSGMSLARPTVQGFGSTAPSPALALITLGVTPTNFVVWLNTGHC